MAATAAPCSTRLSTGDSVRAAMAAVRSRERITERAGSAPVTGSVGPTRFPAGDGITMTAYRPCEGGIRAFRKQRPNRGVYFGKRWGRNAMTERDRAAPAHETQPTHSEDGVDLT